MIKDWEARRVFNRRAALVALGETGLGALLLGRMGYLAVAKGDSYASAAESNRITLHYIPPRRGAIVDATGLPIANNRPAYSVELTPSLAGDITGILDRIAGIVPLSPEERQDILERAASMRASGALSIADDIGWDAYAALNLDYGDIPGLQPLRTYVRNYPDGPAFGHLVGYVGRPTAEQYKETRNPLYLLPGFRIGKDGVERSMEDTLRGTVGARRVEVNARGRIVRELDTRMDIPGHTVQLTIDRGLQSYVARRVGDESCSAVVIDITNGDVKCMLSWPAFDPNVFSNRIPSQLWKDMQEDEHKPLLNKVMQGLYMPGSTFKPAVALAVLEAGISPEETVYCPGYYRLGNHVWHCDKRSGHGHVDMRHGITKSCNVYFYAMAHRIGADAVARTVREVGLGQHFDLPMPVQRAGIIPDSRWKMERYHQKWSGADTLNMAIGQGYVNVNPMQLAVMVARIASGKLVVPRLLAGSPPPPFPPLPIPPEHIEVVRQGMDDVVNSGFGTAGRSRLRIPGVRMGGKTGTAQVVRIAGRFRGGKNVPWRYRDHGLFIGFAPVDEPRYAAAVVVEHGTWGAVAAAPIVRDIFTWIYDRPQAEAELAKIEAGREQHRRAEEARKAREKAEEEAAKRAQDGAPVAPAPPAADPDAR